MKGAVRSGWCLHLPCTGGLAIQIPKEGTGQNNIAASATTQVGASPGPGPAHHACVNTYTLCPLQLETLQKAQATGKTRKRRGIRPSVHGQTLSLQLSDGPLLGRL